MAAAHDQPLARIAPVSKLRGSSAFDGPAVLPGGSAEAVPGMPQNHAATETRSPFVVIVMF